MSNSQIRQYVDAVRHFSRFYTRKIGVLQEGLHGSELALPEARIVYELAQGESITATELAKDLSLDAGYLSRVLRNLQQRGLITKQRSADDGRRYLVSLTDTGRRLFAVIDERSHDEIAAMLSKLSPLDQQRLVKALETAEQLLGAPTEVTPTYILRPHQPGDMGWLAHRQSVLYAQEYGWDTSFEALVARITAEFIQNFNPERERCWIVDRNGEIVGSVFLFESSNNTAQLRLLYVEPSARGVGLGRRLVDECVRFAQQAGYTKITLWTNDVLTAARRVYESAGFRLVKEQSHHSFGCDLVGQDWELVLDPNSATHNRTAHDDSRSVRSESSER